MNITEQVLALLTHELRLKDNIVTLESNLKEDLDVQSLEAIELLMALEDEFKIEFDEKDHEHITTVQNIVDLVNKLKKK
jgi:acyl carrier protein